MTKQMYCELVKAQKLIRALRKRARERPICCLYQSLLQSIDAIETGHRAQGTQHRHGTHRHDHLIPTQ